MVASFPDMHRARMAIEAVGRAGIDGDQISLLGAGVDKAAARTETTEADARFYKHWLWTGLVYSLAGGVIGAVLGILITLALLPLMNLDTTPSAVLVGALLAAFSGAWTGYAIGHSAPAQLEAIESWELALSEDVPGPVMSGCTRISRKWWSTPRRCSGSGQRRSTAWTLTATGAEPGKWGQGSGGRCRV